jgi:ABC-type Mn2+/Zn2+ transport system ATPase subunit
VGSTKGLLGGNDAGKTTIGMIMGLIEPKSDSIHAFGHDMAQELGRMNLASPTWTRRITLRCATICASSRGSGSNFTGN